MKMYTAKNWIIYNVVVYIRGRKKNVALIENLEMRDVIIHCLYRCQQKKSLNLERAKRNICSRVLYWLIGIMCVRALAGLYYTYI